MKSHARTLIHLHYKAPETILTTTITTTLTHETSDANVQRNIELGQTHIVVAIFML